MAGAAKQAFVIAGTSSGCGKTTVTLGLLRALMLRGLRVQPFKIGPDYLDSGWHSAVTGIASRNLDAFMLPIPTLNGLFAKQMQQADVAVIEGVMGLYDGYGTDPNYCSSAAMAKQLGCPVILLVDGKAVSTSIAATVMGFQRFDPTLNIAGVILNRVNSDSHYQLLADAITRYCGIPVLGRVPVMADVALPARHLGLVPAQENAPQDECWQQLAQQIEKTVNIDHLLNLSRLNSLPPGEAPAVPDAALADGLTLALAEDEAFNFYYPDNLELLGQAGVKIQRFSPLHDTKLPDCQMIWLGGGYPEVHGAKLAANIKMRESLQKAHQQRVPLYAECGGLMYLGESLTDGNDETHAMCGVLPGHSQMGKRLTRFGYCEATALHDTLLAKKGETLRGHEFHYSDFSGPLPAALDCCKWRDGVAISRWQGGFQHHATFASYLHVHFAQRPSLLNRWLALARNHL
ncbi:cobyrinate a,c-diamide synthase [Buttiauxella noackiae]|uniref:cobyrinate a,c-diamide synthase n=1 Tax=Buttiauxella noackiae TaxID=82992 RepID=UPI002354EEB4|nr:cobyrinate a,c-diamide synthase [Buttiauxella noackiae]MCA1922457.1 cobyrinate a,c-diamide synthase [Buttiauxella noackiae]